MAGDGTLGLVSMATTGAVSMATNGVVSMTTDATGLVSMVRVCGVLRTIVVARSIGIDDAVSIATAVLVSMVTVSITLVTSGVSTSMGMGDS